MSSIATFFSSERSQLTPTHQDAITPEAAKFRQEAISKVGELRDMDKLRADYLDHNLGNLEFLASSAGEEGLKTLLVAEQDPRMRVFLEDLIQHITNGSQSDSEQGTMKEIHRNFTQAESFLADFEGGFAAYVTEKEGEAQEQLRFIAKIEGKAPQTVDTELQSRQEIAGPIQGADLLLQSGELMQIARTLIGDGTFDRPGCPTLFGGFLFFLNETGRLAELGLSDIMENFEEIVAQEDHPVISQSFFRFNTGMSGMPSTALSKLRLFLKVEFFPQNGYVRC